MHLTPYSFVSLKDLLILDWLQTIIEQIARGQINSLSNSLDPKSVISLTSTTEKVKQFSLYELQLEFTNQAALWLEYCGLRINSNLPLASTIQRWSIF
ncbi:hypothetical protein PPL_02375 [Heterostelium album PN500]|uniref:Uncharacterized protein n=1 Tax=Heterostelium pallidum (strain ATCC 26659 / Pp 5 / PN500) TaxID=670386 RepID=D3AZJ3_HETP5|nr:hypothetical protein PPL_02375 [Heterostelium album PN500]EFA85372.1 hypothetical protein PPL_02375 [Heterostelium album PN500]|eukprot:XP_020437481.1 hypothetical protein PPL_02375 [Heterostelium album PN500]